MIVMPANIFFNFPLNQLLERHIKSEKAFTLLCKFIDKHDEPESRTYVKFDPTNMCSLRSQLRPGARGQSHILPDQQLRERRDLHHELQDRFPSD